MSNTPRIAEKIIMLLPVWLGVLGTILAMIARDPYGFKVLVGMVLLMIGFSLFVKSKLRKLREGKLTSFGMKELDAKEQKLYISGYLLMALGLLIEAYLAASV